MFGLDHSEVMWVFFWKIKDNLENRNIILPASGDKRYKAGMRWIVQVWQKSVAVEDAVQAGFSTR